MCCELIYNIVIVSVLVTLSLIEIHVYNIGDEKKNSCKQVSKRAG